MGKKKGKGKKEKKETNLGLSEVDKTFYELTITDLNRKLARLRTQAQELEEKNEELLQQLQKSKEDGDDIIIYLKRMLQEKNDEIAELRESYQGLEETHVKETKEFLQKIADMEEEYKEMHEMLNSEIKLLEGKLNALEEFRIQRDELMKKYEKQERDMEEQELRHKRELYEVERKFIVSKNLLMREMEERLRKLSTEFQNTTETRIAATTHRMIRENIAINNELDVMLETHQRLTDENLKHKQNSTKAKNAAELLEQEKRIVLAQSRVHRKTIERLTKEHEEMSATLKKNILNQKLFDETKQKLEILNEENKLMHKNLLLMEQNLHASRCENNELKTEVQYAKSKMVLSELTKSRAVLAIKDFLQIQAAPGEDEALKIAKRQDLLNTLLSLLSEELVVKRDSLESICDAKALGKSVYAKGDLGFVPRLVPRPKSKFPVKKTVATRIGPSLEALKAKAPKTVTKKAEEGMAVEEEEVVVESTIASSKTMILEEEEEEEETFYTSESTERAAEESEEEPPPPPPAVDEAAEAAKETPSATKETPSAQTTTAPADEQEHIGEEEETEEGVSVEVTQEGDTASPEETAEEKVPETEPEQ
ncbi:cilia- and flagella-associated protein 157 [Agrilus planipennis]|uniref:Cilia- and flagella-associated protein 157 n=1 Tax=Agrilus planipennis TaxID=224129 RepID=A0A1W4XIF0_AGRPL|nr:cilia- and flagella-associated protein 157 [Agrilus planipennis]